MPEVSTDQLTIVENALVQVRESLDPATTPKEVMNAILEAEQIITGAIDSGKESSPMSNLGEMGGPK